jgi:hypothetical protein
MGNRSGLKARGAFHALVGCIFSLSAVEGLAITRTVIDFDGTINHDQGADAAWRTDWLLYRITSRTVGGQPSIEEFPPFAEAEGTPALPSTLAVSYGEYRQYASKLGKEGEALGDLRAFPLHPDPLWRDRPKFFVPGYYRVSPDVTFQRFRPHPDRKKSYLLEDFEDAVKRVRASRGTMRLTGRAFPLLEAALTRTELSAGVSVFTSRWHLDWEWNQLFDRMWEAGLLRKNGRKGKPAKLAPVRVHSLSGPDSLYYSRGALAERKAEVVAIEAATLVDGPLALQKHEELAVDPVDARSGLKEWRNTLLVAEDDPVYVNAVGSRMMKLSGELGYAQNVKFVLFNAGSAADVAAGRWPWRWVVFHYGFAREALPEEIEQWTGKKPDDCRALLVGDWVQGAP